MLISWFVDNTENIFPFHYLRRWGMILIVAFYVGATLGIWYNVVAIPKQFEVTAQLQTPGLTLKILSEPRSDTRKALESIVMKSVALEGRSGRSWKINNPSIRPVEDFPWKNVIFAGIVGILVAIGLIYVFQEAQEPHAYE